MKESVKKEEGKKRRRKGELGGRRKTNTARYFGFPSLEHTVLVLFALDSQMFLTAPVARCWPSAWRRRGVEPPQHFDGDSITACPLIRMHKRKKGRRREHNKTNTKPKKKTQFSSGLSHRCENGREGATKKGERRVQCPGVD